jgi:glycosyltransferase involved in cell wall biosynthesis
MITSVPMPPAEGLGHYVWNLSTYVVGRGHEVHIVTRGQAGRPSCEKVHGIPIWRPRFYRLYPLHVHLHGLFLQRLVCRIEQEVDVFHVHTPLPPPFQTTRPVLLTVHSTTLADTRARKVDSLLEVLIRLQSLVSTQVERRLISTSRAITAVSTAAARQVCELLPGQTGPVDVTWNGVDTALFGPWDSRSAARRRLLFVGRIAPGKGLPDLLQALGVVAAQCPNVVLSIVGDGPLRKQAARQVARYGLGERVEFLGYVRSREALCTLYQEAWALVLPSYHESLPTVLLEAMASGTPVIATRVGSVPDIIVHGENGLLVSPGAPGELAEAICRLLGDVALGHRLGAEARRTVVQRFSWQIVGDRYLERYRTLLREVA